MKKSRAKVILTCLDCGEVINGGSHMSRHVKQIHGYESYDEYKLKHNLVKSKSCLENEGAVACKLCNLLSHDLTSHILRTHKISIEDYKRDYGKIRSEKYLMDQSNRIKGDKNPAYNHQGKFSPFSNNFIYADKIDREELHKKVKNSIKNSEKRTNTLIYWINLGYSEEEAKVKVSQRQTTFTLEKCIEKYGEEEGTKRWVERQDKWISSFKKSKKDRFSKISQELFCEIFNHIKEDVEFIYFAELGEDKLLDTSGVNNEYKLKFPEKVVLPDFINIKTKKIIEFDGTYWHSETKSRDEVRDKILIKNGYQVLHINEENYRKNKDDVIKECLEFLNV